MQTFDKFYINGEWVTPHAQDSFYDVINPATEQVVAKIAMGDTTDVNNAVAAAKQAFTTYQHSTVKERLTILENILRITRERRQDLADALTAEMGAPRYLAEGAQTEIFIAHTEEMIRVLQSFEFTREQGNNIIKHEPIGVVVGITPWNWPLNQIACKILPVIASGGTMVLKPSEESPMNAIVVMEILHAAGLPKGVVNLILGDGPNVGAALSSHSDVDMVSITGSTRAGAAVAKSGADTVKRIHQELGGKSANIILPDADFENAIINGLKPIIQNSGQSCNAPTRMLIHSSQLEAAKPIIKNFMSNVVVGDPTNADTQMGPVVNQRQYEHIQALIKSGIDEGAEVLVGGLGKPAGLEQGCFVKPTVFVNVNNKMSIAQQEIFGPVLVVISYDTVEEAIAIANDTAYGLSNYVSSQDIEQAVAVAKQLRSGNVHINEAGLDLTTAFGGYKQSGNGREWGLVGLKDFMELKVIFK